MRSGVYIITNLVNGKNYIGETRTLLKRLNQHKNSLIGNKHPNRHLQGAWNIYGEDSFSFSILEECEESRQKELEEYWCKVLNSHDDKYGYNIRLTDKNKIGKMAEETKKLLSLVHKGKVLSESHIENMRKAQLRRGRGQYRSPKAKKSIARANIERSKPVLQLDKQGQIIKLWESRKIASENLNIHYSAICNATLGLAKTAGGYKWKFQ